MSGESIISMIIHLNAKEAAAVSMSTSVCVCVCRESQSGIMWVDEADQFAPGFRIRNYLTENNTNMFALCVTVLGMAQ